MIATVRTRVQHMIQEHKNEAEIIRTHPSADFDAKYGHGKIGPDVFIHELYQALTAKR
jgi:hypothetical protein